MAAMLFQTDHEDLWDPEDYEWDGLELNARKRQAPGGAGCAIKRASTGQLRCQVFGCKSDIASEPAYSKRFKVRGRCCAALLL
jgi:hypothetical protein